LSTILTSSANDLARIFRITCPRWNFTVATVTPISWAICLFTIVWSPSIPVALVVLAIAQMGVRLVFFLQITSGPDNVNNVLAPAFSVLIVLLLLAGSLWIMAHLNQSMIPMDQIMQMQR
jgi:cytochrome o ubiquinol oxidase operon protein cyoD